ncbi:MAG TPA: LytTR family transcriptional regulator DNA-binding domain-containing protein [Pyrinomonadaceae bacterium]|nr:LytTR family transcriptional regulator DNA-binding domain-containing protein [Pyrinomonadaceae bacterium]
MAICRALIVDDERLARKEMRALLAEFAPVEVVAEAESVAQAKGILESERIDLVFLDVQLAGETGFDLLAQTGARFRTIFVTAFDAFAVRAFEVNALDYLLKPVHPERLARALDKIFRGEVTDPSPAPRPLAFDDRLWLELGDRSIFLKVEHITHIVAAGDYAEIFAAGRPALLTEKPLREWERRLPAKHFQRILRNCIVNLEAIERVERWFNRTYRLYLKNSPAPLSVSRRHAAALKTRFE